MQLGKLYKLVFSRTKSTNFIQDSAIKALNYFKFKTKYNSFSAQVSINGISIFAPSEINESISVLEKFVALDSSNKLQVQWNEDDYNSVAIEIKEVELLRDVVPPVITVNPQVRQLTNQKNFTVTISDDSRVKSVLSVNGSVSKTNLKAFTFSLVEGPNSVTLQTVDSFGNKSSFNLSTTVDTIPALLTSASPTSAVTLYSNQLPYSFPVSVAFNKPLQSVLIYGQPATISSDQKSASAVVQAILAGIQNIQIVATDLAGNVTTTVSSPNLIYTTLPPKLNLSVTDGLRINQANYNLMFAIDSLIPTTAKINVNGIDVFTTDLKNVQFLIYTLKEGINTITISASDAAGNLSLPSVFTVILDTVPPALTSVSPQNNENFYTNSLPFNISLAAVFNELVQSVKINGSAVSLSSPNSISAQVPVYNAGDNLITIEAIDLAGNLATIQKHVYINYSTKLPVLTFNPKLDNILTNQPRITISGVSDVLLKSISVNGNPMSIGLDGQSFSGFFDAIQDGVYQLSIAATDIFGNTTTTIKRVRVLIDLPQQLLNFSPTLVKTATGYRIDYGPLFNGPDKDSICKALDQVFAAIPEAHAALDQIDHVKADINKYKDIVPDIVTRNAPDTSGVRQFLGTVEEPLNRIKGAYLSVCKNVDILPALDCPTDRMLFKLIMGDFPEPFIIRQLTFIPLSVQDLLISRTNICTGFDDSGLSCEEMVKLTPLIGEILSPAVADLMSSPAAQGIMDILLCEDLCAAPAIKAAPLLCKDIQVPGLPRIKKIPTRFNFGGPGGGVSIDWGGSSDCGGFFNSCGGGGSSCGWFESCGGVDSTGGINGRDFACSAFPSLWFCQSNNPLVSTPPNVTTVVHIDPLPSCDPNIKLIDFINSNPQNATITVSRFLASCLNSPVAYMPDLKVPTITVTSPANNSQALASTVRVTGFVDDVSSKVKIQGVFVSTIVGANGIYFDTTISVPADGLIKVEAADAAGNRAIPVQIQVIIPQVGPTIISSGYGHACAVVNDNVKCAGQNSFGQLGNGLNDNTSIAVLTLGLPPGVTGVSAGDSHSCAVASNQIYCWGSNLDGQLGDLTKTNRNKAVLVSGLAGAKGVSTGSNFSCAITNGTVSCWGNNDLGQLGDGSTVSRLAPAPVIDLNEEVKQISSGYYHTCALLVSGNIKCWGWNAYGQLGNGTQQSSSSPVIVVGVSGTAQSVSVGSYHSCALIGGVANCWGYNNFGGLGDGTTTNKTVPVPVQNLPPIVTSLNAGSTSSCAISGGEVYCWGRNPFGELGDGTTVDRLLPVIIPGYGQVTKMISIGNLLGCGIVNSDIKCSSNPEFLTNTPKIITGFR